MNTLASLSLSTRLTRELLDAGFMNVELLRQLPRSALAAAGIGRQGRICLARAILDVLGCLPDWYEPQKTLAREALTTQKARETGLVPVAGPYTLSTEALALEKAMSAFRVRHEACAVVRRRDGRLDLWRKPALCSKNPIGSDCA